jgi:ubiquitin carboxyl-terminal hydrolase 10
VHTISDALQFISHPQSVQVSSQTRPGVTVEASQQVLIETLPPTLVLHLKRFLYDTKVGNVVKLGKPISFTPELEIDQGHFGSSFVLCLF